MTGTHPGVYVNTCGTNHAQLWLNQPVPVIAGGKPYSYTEFVNLHPRAAGPERHHSRHQRVLQQSSGGHPLDPPLIPQRWPLAWPAGATGLRSGRGAEDGGVVEDRLPG